MREEFILAAIAEIGIIAVALIYDGTYIQTALGVLVGLLGGYGVAKTAGKENVESSGSSTDG